MSVRQAQQQAEALLTRLRIRSIPVDVGAIAGQLDIPVIYDDLGPEASGLVIFGPEGTCIVVQKTDHRKRRRFSVAHELGHILLEHQFVDGEHVHVDNGHSLIWRDERAASGEDPKEREANAFAATLLMPAAEVRRRAASITGGKSLRDFHVRELATDFDVSELAMTIRLQNLGML